MLHRCKSSRILPLNVLRDANDSQVRRWPPGLTAQSPHAAKRPEAESQEADDRIIIDPTHTQIRGRCSRSPAGLNNTAQGKRSAALGQRGAKFPAPKGQRSNPKIAAYQRRLRRTVLRTAAHRQAVARQAKLGVSCGVKGPA